MFYFWVVVFIKMYFSGAVQTNLKVLLYANMVEALWDDHHPSLHIEPQGHLG